MQKDVTTQNLPRPDPRSLRTRTAIEDAFLDALKSGNQQTNLTVTEISKAAGITRKTFYAHYASLDDVVAARLRRVFEDVLPLFEGPALKLPWASRALTEATLTRLACHRETLAPLLLRANGAPFMAAANEAAEVLLIRALAINSLPPLATAPRTYLLAMIAGVTHGLLLAWARRDFSDPAKDLAVVMDAALSEGIQRLLVPASGRQQP